MTTYYVGAGGNDGNSGTSWANRKLTLNGAEDVPVAAGDTVYVAPGVYREILTCDVAGSGGSPITYIGDVTGEHTDGVGGIVRITGSDNDQTATRAQTIDINQRDYRTFRGFFCNLTTGGSINLSDSSNNCIIEDCVVAQYGANQGVIIQSSAGGHIVRRCLFFEGYIGVSFTWSVVFDDSDNLVENCIFMVRDMGVLTTRVGGITVKNNTFLCGSYGVRVVTALSAGQTIDVYNNILTGLGVGVRGTALGEVVEDYNTFYNNGTDRNTVNTGANSVSYPAMLNPPILLDGFRFPWWYGELSKWSQIARIAGTSEATEDFFGISRPATSSKKSWGAIQATGAIRETGTTQGSSAASVKLPDAGEQFLMRVPITAVSTTISIYVYREANYAGDNPQMIIRQPGQSDRTTTDTGSASAWNQLTDTFTPASLPPYVDVFIKSRNTATSGDYDVFFDTLAVS